MLTVDQIAVLRGLTLEGRPEVELLGDLGWKTQRRRLQDTLNELIDKKWAVADTSKSTLSVRITPQGRTVLTHLAPGPRAPRNERQGVTGPWPTIQCWTWLEREGRAWVQLVALRSEPGIDAVDLAAPTSRNQLLRWVADVEVANQLRADETSADETHPRWPAVSLWAWREAGGSAAEEHLWVSTAAEETVTATQVWLPADPHKLDQLTDAVSRAVCLAGRNYDFKRAVENLRADSQPRVPRMVESRRSRSIRTVSGGLPGHGKRR